MAPGHRKAVEGRGHFSKEMVLPTILWGLVSGWVRADPWTVHNACSWTSTGQKNNPSLYFSFILPGMTFRFFGNQHHLGPKTTQSIFLHGVKMCDLYWVKDFLEIWNLSGNWWWALMWAELSLFSGWCHKPPVSQNDFSGGRTIIVK